MKTFEECQLTGLPATVKGENRVINDLLEKSLPPNI
jgi:hypothetical protein